MNSEWTKHLQTLQKSFLRRSIDRQILGAAVTVAVGTLAVKLAAFIKEAVVAWKFGTGDDIDAFLIALLVPSFLINMIAESFNVALIPTYIQVREQKGNEAAQQLFSGATVWGIGLLIVTTVLMVMTAPIYLPWVAAGFTPEKLDLTLQLLWAISPTIFLTGVLSIWSAVLNAGERFALAAICPIVTPIITIMLLLTVPTWGVFSLAVGLVFGSAIQIIPIAGTLRKQGIILYPKWYGLDSDLRQVINQYIPMVAGTFLFCSATFIDQSMAAMLSPGSVAALNYGNRVISFPITLATTALGTAVMPYFSKMTASGSWAEIQHTLKRYLLLIFITTTPLTGFLILISEPMTRTLFQRGAFTANDTQIVAQIQMCFSLQIPFYIANLVIVKLISSMKLNYFLIWISGCAIVMNISLNYLFMQWIGIQGIALSTSCVYIFTFACTFLCIRKSLRKRRLTYENQ